MATNHPVLKFRLADVGGQETFATGWFHGNDVLECADSCNRQNSGKALIA